MRITRDKLIELLDNAHHKFQQKVTDNCITYRLKISEDLDMRIEVCSYYYTTYMDIASHNNMSGYYRKVIPLGQIQFDKTPNEMYEELEDECLKNIMDTFTIYKKFFNGK